jgi:hypothetical protein
MQGSNWISIAAVAAGVLFAVWGYRMGFYVIWAVLFNIAISIYLSVMLTPAVAAFLPALFPAGVKQGEPGFWYAYAGLSAAVAFISFLVLQITAMTYFTGTFNISLPKLMENLGAAAIGFVAGYILWGFICFVVLIMPIKESQPVLLKSFTSDTKSREISIPAVSKVVNIVNALSLQSDRRQVRNVISWTLGWDIKEPNETK